MLKDLMTAIKAITQLTRDMSRSKERIDKLESEVENLTKKVYVLGFPLQRERDNATSQREQAKSEQANLLLRLENVLLRAGIKPQVNEILSLTDAPTPNTGPEVPNP